MTVLCSVLVLAAGCGHSKSPGSATASAPAAEPVAPADQAAIDELRALFTPLSPTATSDKQYERREAKRKRLEELERGPPTLAAPALAAFARDAGALDEWRAALLSVAAHTDRERTRPLLESLTLRYDGTTSLGVRTEAMRLWCETSPASAVKELEPVLLQARPNVTLPPKELMLRRWIAAARSIRHPADTLLATIATELAQAPDTRYVAVEELGKERDSAVGRKALETVLVESGSDGLLRRKAAQALRDCLPTDQLCALIKHVGELETDPEFLVFLADMLDKNNCPP